VKRRLSGSRVGLEGPIPGRNLVTTPTAITDLDVVTLTIPPLYLFLLLHQFPVVPCSVFQMYFEETGARGGVVGRAVESESEGILGGVGVGKNVPTPTSI
jgi:hypothetical protein